MHMVRQNKHCCWWFLSQIPRKRRASYKHVLTWRRKRGKKNKKPQTGQRLDASCRKFTCAVERGALGHRQTSGFRHSYPLPYRKLWGDCFHVHVSAWLMSAQLCPARNVAIQLTCKEADLSGMHQTPWKTLVPFSGFNPRTCQSSQVKWS